MKILLYADLDLRLIDGSSTWLASLAEVLDYGGHRIHVLSKVQFSESKVLERLRTRQADLQIYMPADHDPDLTPNQAATQATQLHERHDFDAIIVRGFDACVAFSKQRPLRDRLWSYVTDLPFPLDELSESQSERLNSVAAASHRMLAQTESARSYLEAIAPAAAGKTLLMLPMVPDDAFEMIAQRASTPLRLVYAGKLAKQWRTLEMLSLPVALSARGVAAELVVIGDKFQHDPDDPIWSTRMRQALEDAHEDSETGVTWLGGLTRNQVLTEIAKAHIGIGWRSVDLDSSLEVSTKALEYAACGTAPFANRSTDHAALWGNDYPLLVSGNATVEDAADQIANALSTLGDAATSARTVVELYTMKAAAERFERYLSRSTPITSSWSRTTKIVISSHDFKFMGELADWLQRRSDVHLQFDAWTGLHTHDELSSIEQSENADVVFCEWAGPSLVWHAERKRPGSRLITRLHGFELRGPWLGSLDLDEVDQWIFVSENYRRTAITQLGLNPEVTTVIPNMIDCEDLDRPKLIGSEFQLGMAGLVGYGKRPDRALDLLEELIDSDERYMLRLKGRSPWDYPHEWKDPLQRQLYLDFYARIRRSPQLKSRVVFEPFSPDIASWLRGVGYVLSPSHAESFHLAPAEGMASGAVPVVWARPGAEEIFGAEWIVTDTREAADRILLMNQTAQLSEASARARKQACRWDRDRVLEQWSEALMPR